MKWHEVGMSLSLEACCFDVCGEAKCFLPFGCGKARSPFVTFVERPDTGIFNDISVWKTTTFLKRRTTSIQFLKSV